LTRSEACIKEESLQNKIEEENKREKVFIVTVSVNVVENVFDIFT
jgi:hypothetical protein